MYACLERHHHRNDRIIRITIPATIPSTWLKTKTWQKKNLNSEKYGCDLRCPGFLTWQRDRVYGYTWSLQPLHGEQGSRRVRPHPSCLLGLYGRFHLFNSYFLAAVITRSLAGDCFAILRVRTGCRWLVFCFHFYKYTSISHVITTETEEMLQTTNSLQEWGVRKLGWGAEVAYRPQCLTSLHRHRGIDRCPGHRWHPNFTQWRVHR